MNIELYELIISNPPFAVFTSDLYGKAHANRVWLYANLLANFQPDREALDMDAIMLASLLHDCGRIDDGPDEEHGMRSSQLVMEFIEEHGLVVNEILVEAIILHHYPPSWYVDRDPSTEARIVADADKLDRFRLNIENPCEPHFFELPESKAFMDLSSRINFHSWRSRL